MKLSNPDLKTAECVQNNLQQATKHTELEVNIYIVNI